MQRKELAHGIPHLDSELQNCEVYQYGKQARLPFKHASWRATEKLQPMQLGHGDNHPLPRFDTCPTSIRGGGGNDTSSDTLLPTGHGQRP